MRCSATSVSSASKTASEEKTGGGRAVQLDQVERVDAQVGPGPVGPGAEVVQGVQGGVLGDPAAHLGGHGELGAWVAGQNRR